MPCFFLGLGACTENLRPPRRPSAGCLVHPPFEMGGPNWEEKQVAVRVQVLCAPLTSWPIFFP